LITGSLPLANVEAATTLPIIQEVRYRGPGDDTFTEFTELYGHPGFSLDGYSLAGSTAALARFTASST
jgi:hypothetical protein